MSFDQLPPELVIVVADADAEQMLSAFLCRGIERKCLRSVQWAIRRDPMRDASLCQHPTKALVDVNPASIKVVVMFDHQGCGREQEAAGVVEEHIIQELLRAGFARGNVCCIVLSPELECVLVPVWDRLSEILAERRSENVPQHREVLTKAGLLAAHQGVSEQEWKQMLAERPKECVDGLLRLLRLRHQPALFGELGQLLSLSSVKGSAVAARLAETLVAWFGAGGSRDV